MSCQQVPTTPAFNPYPRSVQVGEFDVAIDGGIWVAIGGYGNEDIIDICEQREIAYLLRLRKTSNVKRLIERLFNRQDWSRATESSQGWQAIEDLSLIHI